MAKPALHPLLLAIIAGVGKRTEDPIIQWDEATGIFTVQVDGRDQGRFIGKKGVVFWAINAVFWYAGIQQHDRPCKVALMEPEVRGDPIVIPFKPNCKWDREKIKNLTELLVHSTVSKENVRSIRITDTGHAEAVAEIAIDSKLKKDREDPNLAEAIETIISAAGRSDGCTITTKFSWAQN